MVSEQFAARSRIARLKFFIPASAKKVCRQRLGKFLQDQQFDCLISAGFAGALDNDLKIGDLFLAENFSTVHLSETRACAFRFAHSYRESFDGAGVDRFS